MGLRLSASRLWLPRSVLLRELDRVAELTTSALDQLVEERDPGALQAVREGDPPYEGDLEQRRLAMALSHRRRVEALVDLMGRDDAVAEGRRRLFPVGERLGAEARERLGVGDGMAELVVAAQVLYRVLGIHFEEEERADGTVVLHISRCALTEGYEEVTCMVMSAADEGMVRGLNPRARLAFRERLTAGCTACLADLTMGPSGGEGAEG